MNQEVLRRVRKVTLAFFATVGAAVFIVVLLRIDQAIAPRFENVIEHFPDGTSVPAAIYLRQDHSPFSSAEITFDLVLPSVWTAKTFNVLLHDSIDSFVVNGEQIVFDPTKRLDLRSVLHVGENSVSVHLLAGARRFHILGFEPSFMSAEKALLTFGSIVIILLWLFALFRLGFLSRLPRSSVALLFVAAFLATLYMTATPGYFRSHDWWGHYAYIDYLVDTFRIPRAGTSWQAHQPPLAYILYAVMYAPILYLSGLDSLHLLMFLQFVSLGAVVVILALGLALITAAVSDRKAAFVASFFFTNSIALLSMASQVSNDVILMLLGMIWVMQIHYLRTSTRPMRSVFLLGIVIGLGFLTKFNALPWLIITIALFPFYFHSFPRLARGIATLLITVMLVAGPFTLWRIFTSSSADPVSNAHFQEGAQFLSLSPRELLTFRPLALIQRPFADTALNSDGTYFLESIFRRGLILSSAQTRDGAYLMIFALLLLPLFFYGLFVCLRRRELVHFPLIILFSIGALLLFRTLYPYSSAQHVRYIAYAILPLAIILGEATRRLRPLPLKALAEILVLVFSVCSGLSIVGLSLA